MRFLKTLRTIIKAVGILDALIDEFERESAQKQEARDRISKIYQNASNLK